MTSSAPLPLGAFGKIPSYVEYIRRYPQDPAFLAWNSWLSESMEWSVRHAGRAFSVPYRAGSAYAVLFHSAASENVLAGALAPSTDSAGREFPFSALAVLGNARRFAKTPQVLPLQVEHVWQQTSDLVIEATTRPAFVLEERLARTRIDPAPEARDVLPAYEDWARTLPMLELGELLYGASGAARFPAAVRAVLDALGAARPADRQSRALSLRLPLGELGGAAVCFWLDLARRAGQLTSAIPDFFWSHDGRVGQLLLHLGPAPKSTLVELWMPGQERDSCRDLSRIPAVESELPHAQPRPELARVLQRSDASILELLEAVSARAVLGRGRE